MPKKWFKRWHGWHQWLGFISFIALTTAMFAYNWGIALGAMFIGAALLYYTFVAELDFRQTMKTYIATLTHRVKQTGEDVITALPFGIVLINEQGAVEWHNPFMAEMMGKASIVGESITDYFPTLKNFKENEMTVELVFQQDTYRVRVHADQGLLYFLKVTDQVMLQKKYDDTRVAMGIVMMDNFDEVTQGMDDQTRSMVLAKVIAAITDWATKNNIYLRRTASDRFMFLLDQQGLQGLEANKFDILDHVRDLTAEHKLPMTLSIGVGGHAENFIALGQLTQAALDIALGRGGDQAAVKVGDKVSFFGGRTNAVEKRNRVRARVVSHALRDLMKDSDQVVIMGHRFPDMDAIGAAIGVWKMARMANKPASIVLEKVNVSIQRLMEEVELHKDLNDAFIEPDQALEKRTAKTLYVVVDTHKASLVAEPKLLQQTSRVVIIDHHRRGEEFLGDSTLIYMEPYASSTCELVTELLQYFQERVSLEVVEATAMLAGMIVDTKSFTQRTGSRTFEAAAFLRRNGADAALVQKLLKEDLAEFKRKSEIIQNTQVVHERIAIATGLEGVKYTPLTTALAADQLLNMSEISASFVACERQDGLIGVSARSLGKMNVQVVMERLGGGGHLTNAAAQVEGTLGEVVERLKVIIEEFIQEEGFTE
jgi:c-di-AMP phosphodiesterase-like protein